MRFFTIFGTTVLLGAATASAQVRVTITDLGNPTGGGQTASAFQAYLMTLTSTSGSNINAVDFGGTAGSTFPGITGRLLQRASLDPDAQSRTFTPQNAARNNESVFSFDSHFLPPGNVRVDVAQPTEDNDGVNPPGGEPRDTATGDFGTGSFLTGTFAISGTNQSPNLDLFYLVIPDGAAVNYSGRVSTATGAFPVGGQIPEPAAAGLIGMAACGLLARRRARA